MAPAFFGLFMVIEHHVYPVDDLREHELNSKCWCTPEVDDENPGVWVHNSMDRREEYENGRKLS